MIVHVSLKPHSRRAGGPLSQPDALPLGKQIVMPGAAIVRVILRAQATDRIDAEQQCIKQSDGTATVLYLNG